MAVVAKDTTKTVKLVSISDHEDIVQGYLNGAVSSGDLLVENSDGTYSKAGTGVNRVQGMAIYDAKDGQYVDILKTGEVDGFTGMTPGQYMWPSGTTGGALDTTAKTYATTPAVEYSPCAVALRSTRIRFSVL